MRSGADPWSARARLIGSEAVTRIETGGAGNYAGWTGEQVQALLASNPAGGVNLRVMLKLYPPVRLRCDSRLRLLRFPVKALRRRLRSSLGSARKLTRLKQMPPTKVLAVRVPILCHSRVQQLVRRTLRGCPSCRRRPETDTKARGRTAMDA